MMMALDQLMLADDLKHEDAAILCNRGREKINSIRSDAKGGRLMIKSTYTKYIIYSKGDSAKKIFGETNHAESI